MLKSMSVRATLLAIACMASWSAFAMADAPKKVEIPAGDLRPALLQVSKVFNVELFYDPGQLKGLRTRGLSGTYTPHDAIEALLEGTALELRTDPSGAMLIAPAHTNLASKGDGDRAAGQSNSTDPRTGDSLQLAQAAPPSSTGVVPIGDDEKKKREKSEKDEVLQEVVVTGSHIHGSANDTAPMIVIDRAEIERSGFTTTAQLVDSFPENFRGGAVGATADGQLGTGNLAPQNDSFGTGINLRGLGNSSTLVLIDGHRVAATAEGLFVDVSTIPLAAIDRVEILTDGASAIYGSDAVAGVVNFILRKDYDGQETWGTYGSGTDGTRHQTLLGQAVGRDWQGGNAVATLQYQDLGNLSAGDRPYTSSAQLPTDLLPESRQYSALFSGQQQLPAGFSLSADALYSHSSSTQNQQAPGELQTTSPVVNNGTAALTMDYRPNDRWRIGASASYSLEDNDGVFYYTPGFLPYCGSGPCPLNFHDIYRVMDGELTADGTLFDSPGGPAKIAIGTSYRKEAQTTDFLQLAGTSTQFSRHVSAEFGELEVPIVGSGNSHAGLEKLTVSLAVRHDDYSDFGSTTNPRYGVAWDPVHGVRVRGSYSSSYRAPTALETVLASPPIPLLAQQDFPLGAATVPVLYALGVPGGNQLLPEKSRNWSTGIVLEPALIEHLKLSLNYFNIRYRDRILTPSFDANALSEPAVYGPLITSIASDSAAQAFINNFTSQGGEFINQTGGAPGVGVRYLLNGFEQNASLVTTSGVDILADYRFSAGANNFAVALNSTFLDSLNTAYTATTQSTNLVNTFSNPLHWRARGQFNWTRGPWSFTSAINFSGSYIDTSTIPFASVASWTTVDAQLAYQVPLLKGTTLSLSCINLLDRYPPFVSGATQYESAIHYDVANANPLGRVLSLAAHVAW